MASTTKISAILILEIFLLSNLQFVWVSAADSDSHILSSSGSVRLVYRYTVALDGSGDFSDIVSAVDAVPPGERGVIEIAEGLYDLNPDYRYPYKVIPARSEITIRGNGIDRTIIRSFPEKQFAGAHVRTPTVYSTDDIQGFALENLTLIQNGSPDNLGWNAIDLRGENSDIVIKNVKITDVTGAAISITRFTNVLVEGCYMEMAFTGVTLSGGSNGIIKGNTIKNTLGDGVFPQTFSSTILSVSNVLIIDNHLENIGDTGIDITSNYLGPPHSNITAVGNTLINAHIRVSNAHHIKILDNELLNGKSWIDIDGGAGRAIDILIENNRITSSRKEAIGLFGAEDCRIINNVITSLPPSPNTIQCGISAAVWSSLVIEGNIISNPASYGIDFGGWSIGNNQIVIRNNTVTDFGNIGIYDNGKSQGLALIENNIIYDSNNPFESTYGIRTDFEANSWIIRYNRIYAGSVEHISAPNSEVYENIFEPFE